MDEEQQVGRAHVSVNGNSGTVVADSENMPQRRKVDEVLEIEDEDARANRLGGCSSWISFAPFFAFQREDCSMFPLTAVRSSRYTESIFKKLDSGSPSFLGPIDSRLPNLQFDFGERKTWAVEPPSECAYPYHIDYLYVFDAQVTLSPSTLPRPSVPTPNGGLQHDIESTNRNRPAKR